MYKNWKFSGFGILLLFLTYKNLILCWGLNDEGLALLKLKEKVAIDPFGALKDWKDEVGLINPCLWFGVKCSDDAKVVVLDLKDLCLEGTLAPELGNLVHIKSIILRNNSFTGIIPEGIGDLAELEVLDLGCNNFSGPLPRDLGNNLSMTILLLDNNELLDYLSPEIRQLNMLSEMQVDENQLRNAARGSSCNTGSFTRNVAEAENAVHKRKLLSPSPSSPPSPSSKSNVTRFFNPYANISSPPPPGFLRRPIPVKPSPPPKSSVPPAQNPNASSSHSVLPPSSPSPSALLPSPSVIPVQGSSSRHRRSAIIVGVVGGTICLLISIIGIYLCKSRKATVKPWATGLSGQLQKAFVTGVPKLKRSELEAGCEDFSNVIGTSPIGTLYKGTLSSGVEIAVASVLATSAKDWSEISEVQFRKKIETLSKVNHKNFVNLLGYCEEQKPLTRMMVFEYAPNGTLFEHLHIKESEHLDWGMRLRIAMGMAYCLDHMHQLDPPITHNNLNSSSVSLTEDYAAKISDFTFSNKTATLEASKLLDAPLACLESNVYSFGVLLFEMVSGRLPYAVENDDSLDDWASDYLRTVQPINETVDPTLESFEEEKLERIYDVVKSCTHPDPNQRPTMKEVVARLREITAIAPEAAIPKLSPLWWAELEISSPDDSN